MAENYARPAPLRQPAGLAGRSEPQSSSSVNSSEAGDLAWDPGLIIRDPQISQTVCLTSYIQAMFLWVSSLSPSEMPHKEYASLEALGNIPAHEYHVVCTKHKHVNYIGTHSCAKLGCS